MNKIIESITNYEKVRSRILANLTKEELQKARMLCDPQLKRFNDMQPDERDRVIYSEVMSYGPYYPDIPDYEGNHKTDEPFQLTQRLDHAFQVFNYVLVPEKMSLVPCTSSEGTFWIVYFEDVYLGVGQTVQMAISKTAIIMNDVLTYKLNV